MSKPGSSLRTTFSYEVHPDVYIGRAWATCWLAALVLAALAAYKNGVLDAAYLVPLPFGTWQTHDPGGGLFIETWATIAVNALQFGFGIWGAVLIFTGVYRAATTRKAFMFCLTLGAAFLAFTYFLPIWTPPALKFATDQYPFLVQ